MHRLGGWSYLYAKTSQRNKGRSPKTATLVPLPFRERGMGSSAAKLP
ncbi:MAG: hypothetical protein BLITH_0811 [Brockia lithotrophica]|uniref:Uncharacterized protein n=1 Tax=Brockia lithotrophica TaxID=933949 RepID=A0A2T5G8V7_9BACL|nr:MAG: hypothetical protein BLITH_0811 [Brockia lithotrophica]